MYILMDINKIIYVIGEHVDSVGTEQSRVKWNNLSYLALST
jgi:hypothetical protein